MTQHQKTNIVTIALSIVAALAVFLWSLDLMTATLESIGNETVMNVVNVTSNPFISLFIGLFITAVIQSSSTSTSLIVAIVASGSLTLENAVPMVIGANIGTTLTSTIVSLSYITNNKEFKRAIACGVMHDFFNIMAATIIFPLEYYYQVLSNSAKYTARLFHNPANTIDQNNTGGSGIFDNINQWISQVVDNDIVLMVIAFIALLTSIKMISRFISRKITNVSDTRFTDVFFSNPRNSFGLGTLLTAGIQSSSITTTLIVPFSATGKIPNIKIFPYIIGANIGTTITALIAALNKSEAALSIAMAHFIFNLLGTLIFLPFPILRNIPTSYAEKFGSMTMRYKIAGFFYILVIFFILPLALILFNRL